jgi:hypothetical protein
MARPVQARVRRGGGLSTEHEELIANLTGVAKAETKAERNKALQALRYARLRREGIVTWTFETASVPRKDLITRAFDHVQPFFRRV